MSYKTLASFLFTFLVASYLYANPFEAPRDSIGMERKGNSLLVLHKVEAGESLTALARKYHTNIKAIQDENPGLAAGLKAGEVIKIPYLVSHSQVSTGQKTHKVAAGQGLYSIARTYNVSVADLRAWNNLTSDNLQEGQELIVSGGKETAAAEPATSSPNTVKEAGSKHTTKPKTHRVARGEGLSTIARKYKVTVSDLKKWNHLSSSSINAGKVLIVSAPVKRVENHAPEEVSEKQAEVPASTVVTSHAEEIAKKDSKRKPESKTSSSVKDGEDVDPTGIQARAEAEEKSEKEDYGRKETHTVSNVAVVANTSGFPKVVETGLAESISDSGDTEGYYALHRTAPVGTILQVRNEMNNLSVFVKVIGKLPDTGTNDKLIVKITRKAYERLAGVDKRFRVEVTYLPN